MNNNTHAILFVDDEEKARKMFSRLISPHYKVLTAGDVKEAMAVLEAEHQNIGVLITDQRMPGLLGVDLLRHVRKEFPSILRILTTAYSDLDDAIEAVNTGEIFRYINKPWNPDDLIMDLRLAMNFFHLEQDRQQLIKEKLSVSQRKAGIDTIKNLISMVSSQTAFDNPKYAIKSLLEQLADPQSAYSISADPVNSAFWDNDIANVVSMIQIGAHLGDSSQKWQPLIPDYSKTNPINLNDCLQSANNEIASNATLEGTETTVETALSADALMMVLSTGIQSLASANTTVKPEQVDDTLKITLNTTEPTSWLVEKLKLISEKKHTKEFADLIALFLYVQQLSGSINLGFDGHKLKELAVNIPTSSNRVAKDNVDDPFWIEDLMINFN